MKITATIAEIRAAMEKQNAMRTYGVIRRLKPRVERTNHTMRHFIACVRVEYGIVMACCVSECALFRVQKNRGSYKHN